MNDQTQEPERGRIVTVGDAISRVLRANQLHRTGRGAPSSGDRSTLQVFDAWNQAAGEALARRAVPVRFERGELVVQVESAAHHQELVGFTGPQLLRKTNALLQGSQDLTVQRIDFRLKR